MSHHLWPVATAIVLLSASAHADEGQWTPDQIARLDQTRLEAMGLQLRPQEIYNDQDGGLMRAAINYGGCSAAFISSEGLIATNHHCAYSDLQSRSTPENDYIKDGFVARARADELHAKNRGTVKVLIQISDVTPHVRDKISESDGETVRYRVAERAKKELVADCENKTPHHRCQVAAFYGGSVYRLFEYLELKDVRIVYAPPAGVGEYGGDVDNWMWPRHTGDFALLRAYVGPDGEPAEFDEANLPYRPSRYLKVSPDGVSSRDFVMLMGYPGRTNRYLPAIEVKRQITQVLPMRADFYGEWVDLLEAQAQRGNDVRIKVAAIKKSFANRAKNARGMLAGIKRMGLLRRVVARDAKLQGAALKAQQALTKRRGQHYPRAFLLGMLSRGPSLLSLAVDLVRRAREGEKPDLQRRKAYMDRSEKKLLKKQKKRLRNFDVEVETHLLASAIDRASGLGIEALDISAELDDVRALVSASKLNDGALVQKLFDERSFVALEALDDPVMKLALALVPAIEASESEDDAIDGAALVADPAWFEQLRKMYAGPIYPDANSTLRFSYASVRGYAPRDGLWATPQTKLGGAMAKHHGKEPFDLPEKVRAAAPSAKDSYWLDRQLGDVPICFLANADTTGGNSGSPVVNGRGEFVGLNFDRVWENIAGDFGYNPPLSRNIIADARYLWWNLDRVDDAGNLLEELGLADYRTMAPRSHWDRPPRPPARNPIGCAMSPDTPVSQRSFKTLVMTLLFGLALALRRDTLVAAFRRRHERP